MIDFLAGITVIIACIFTVYCYSELVFIRHINTEDGEEKEKERLRIYKIKMSYRYLVGFISFFIMGILGYLFNCDFISFQNRVSGVQQFIVFLSVFMILKYIESRKEKYKINNNRVSGGNSGKIMEVIMWICLIGTIMAFLF